MTSLIELKQHYSTSKEFFRRYGNILFFVGGFVFDSLTLVRIDSVLDLVLQTIYLGLITLLLIIQARIEGGSWTPTGMAAKLWAYETEVIHFFYGGLLSAYVIFYFKSTSFSRSFIFLSVIILLMFANEMPQIREAGSSMRLGLYALCLVSFLNYLIPVLLGHMGWLIFLLGWVLSCIGLYFLVRTLARYSREPDREKWRLAWSPAAVLILIFALYSAKLIPPVPLSLKYVGIYRSAERFGNRYKLTYQKPPWTKFWRKDERDFLARPGDSITCFVSVFAPRRFSSQIFLRWSKRNSATGQWMPADHIPLDIKGGRGEGFRATMVKENYDPGQWNVDIETDDGRVLGGRTFTILSDPSTEERTWKTRWM